MSIKSSFMSWYFRRNFSGVSLPSASAVTMDPLGWRHCWRIQRISGSSSARRTVMGSIREGVFHGRSIIALSVAPGCCVCCQSRSLGEPLPAGSAHPIHTSLPGTAVFRNRLSTLANNDLRVKGFCRNSIRWSVMPWWTTTLSV